MLSIVAYVEQKDIEFFYFLNRRLYCRPLSSFMKTVTQLGSTVFAMLVSVFFILFNLRTGTVLILNLVLSQAAIQSLKRTVNRPRPYKTYDWVIALKPPKCVYSFPSGHSSSAFSIALSLSVFFPGLRVMLFSLALIVGISRVCLGYHYPTDVSAGLAISYVTFLIVKIII